MIFRSNADHTRFHHGAEVYFDKEGIAYCKPLEVKIARAAVRIYVMILREVCVLIVITRKEERICYPNMVI